MRPKANAFDGCPLPAVKNLDSASALERCNTLRRELLLKQRLRQEKEKEKTLRALQEKTKENKVGNTTDMSMSSGNISELEKNRSSGKELDALIQFFETDIQKTEEQMTPNSKKRRKNDSTVSLTSEQRAALLKKTQSEWAKVQGLASGQESAVAVGSESPKKIICDGQKQKSACSTPDARSPACSPQTPRSPKISSVAQGESTWDMEKVKAVASPMRNHRRISLGALQTSPEPGPSAFLAGLQASPQPSPSSHVDRDLEKTSTQIAGIDEALEKAARIEKWQAADDPEKAARIAKWEAVLSPAPRVRTKLSTDAQSLEEGAEKRTPRAIRAYLDRSKSLPPKRSPGRDRSETPMASRDRSRTPVTTPGTMGPPRRVPRKLIEPDFSMPQQLDLDPLGYCPPVNRPGSSLNSSSKVLHKGILAGLSAFVTSNASPACQTGLGRERSIARSVTRSESLSRASSFDGDRERSITRCESVLPLRSESIRRCPSFDADRDGSVARSDRNASVARYDRLTSVARSERHGSVARSESAHTGTTVSQRVRMLTKFLHDDDWKVRQAAVQDLMKLEDDTLAAAGFLKVNRGRSVFCEPRTEEVLEVCESDSDLEILEVTDAEK